MWSCMFGRNSGGKKKIPRKNYLRRIISSLFPFLSYFLFSSWTDSDCQRDLLSAFAYVSLFAPL